ncbi:ABC transporter ATP-binding protein [bacterium]|nr:ABC transporter ATP-binding protein [bacterium]
MMLKPKVGAFADENSRNLVRRVLRENFHLYISRYVFAFLLMAGAAVATGASAFLIQKVTAVLFGASETFKSTPTVNEATSHAKRWLPDVSEWISSFFNTGPGLVRIIEVALAIVIVFFIKGACQYGSSVILSKIGNNIVARQQRRIGNHILNQSLAFLVHFPSSDLITRISQAAGSARDVMNLLMSRVQDVLTAIALLVTMFVVDWRLSCAALLIIAPVIIALSGVIRRIRKIARSSFLGIIQVIAAIQEAIIGNKLIKSYNLEPHMQRRLDEAISAVEKLSNKMAVVSNRTSPIMETMGGIVIAAIVFYGGYRNLIQGQNAGSLLAFLTALLLAYEPIKRIAKANVSLHSSLISVQMLYNVLDADHSIPDVPDAPPLRVTQGDISLRDVTFSYRPDQPVLHGVSLVCPGGHVTALVGPSGSGKSTIFNLLERFYRPDSGVVEIDGQDISLHATASLRDQLSLVSQDTFLFADTLRNNIRLARQDATDEEVEDAARAAFAHDFILEQPQGYDTQVGENGGNLSGGQRQRISIARAFLKNAPILLLDEATSALDSESEQQIQLAFDRLMQGRTTIVIAHRFSTIRNARKIHVMENGRLVASGSHQELISNQRGLYAHLYRLQFQEAEMPEIS